MHIPEKKSIQNAKIWIKLLILQKKMADAQGGQPLREKRNYVFSKCWVNFEQIQKTKDKAKFLNLLFFS